MFDQYMWPILLAQITMIVSNASYVSSQFCLKIAFSVFTFCAGSDIRTSFLKFINFWGNLDFFQMIFTTSTIDHVVWQKRQQQNEIVKIKIKFTSEARKQGNGSVTSKKSPNVYKSCPKMISLE